MDENNLKRCCSCGKYKELYEFSPDKRNTNGLKGRCKACYRDYWHGLNKTDKGLEMKRRWRTKKMRQNKSNIKRQGKLKMRHVSQADFYRICELLKEKAAKNELKGRRYCDVTKELSTEMGLDLAEQTVVNAKTAAGIDWVSPNILRKSALEEKVNRLERVIERLCHDLDIDISDIKDDE